MSEVKDHVKRVYQIDDKTFSTPESAALHYVMLVHADSLRRRDDGVKDPAVVTFRELMDRFDCSNAEDEAGNFGIFVRWCIEYFGVFENMKAFYLDILDEIKEL